MSTAKETAKRAFTALSDALNKGVPDGAELKCKVVVIVEDQQNDTAGGAVFANVQADGIMEMMHNVARSIIASEAEETRQ